MSNIDIRPYDTDNKGRYTYFHTPTQIKFIDLNEYNDSGEITMIGAIAYRDEIICGCCGGCVDLCDYYSDCPEELDSTELIKVYYDWIDISEEIKGGE